MPGHDTSFIRRISFMPRWTGICLRRAAESRAPEARTNLEHRTRIYCPCNPCKSSIGSNVGKRSYTSNLPEEDLVGRSPWFFLRASAFEEPGCAGYCPMFEIELGLPHGILVMPYVRFCAN